VFRSQILVLEMRVVQLLERGCQRLKIEAVCLGKADAGCEAEQPLPLHFVIAPSDNTGQGIVKRLSELRVAEFAADHQRSAVCWTVAVLDCLGFLQRMRKRERGALRVVFAVPDCGSEFKHQRFLVCLSADLLVCCAEVRAVLENCSKTVSQLTSFDASTALVIAPVEDTSDDAPGLPLILLLGDVDAIHGEQRR